MQYLDPVDAEEAQYHMNHQILHGRELTVVFAEENRKKPGEMRARDRLVCPMIIIVYQAFYFLVHISTL